MPDPTGLMLNILFSSIGLGYFIFGKKQARPVVLIAGVLLMVVPYLIGNNYLLTAVCVLIMAAPKFF